MFAVNMSLELSGHGGSQVIGKANQTSPTSSILAVITGAKNESHLSGEIAWRSTSPAGAS